MRLTNEDSAIIEYVKRLFRGRGPLFWLFVVPAGAMAWLWLLATFCRLMAQAVDY